MIGGKDDQVVLPPLQDIPTLNLDDFDRELVSLDPHLEEIAEDPAATLGGVDRHRLGPVEQPHGADQPRACPRIWSL